jgi:hypothetical protein
MTKSKVMIYSKIIISAKLWMTQMMMDADDGR